MEGMGRGGEPPLSCLGLRPREAFLAARSSDRRSLSAPARRGLAAFATGGVDAAEERRVGVLVRALECGARASRRGSRRSYGPIIHCRAVANRISVRLVLGASAGGHAVDRARGVRAAFARVATGVRCQEFGALGINVNGVGAKPIGPPSARRRAATLALRTVAHETSAHGLRQLACRHAAPQSRSEASDR